MLTITVRGEEVWDMDTEEFSNTFEFVLELEHSLVSLSKWEAIYKKPFISADSRTDEETLGYVKAMTLTPNVPPEVYANISEENQKEIAAYIEDQMTATWFSDQTKDKKTGEQITAELIYYWMFSAGVDKECENWHLNRLITLLRVFSAKNSPPKKMSQAEIAARNREINARRRAELKTTG